MQIIAGNIQWVSNIKSAWYFILFHRMLNMRLYKYVFSVLCLLVFTPSNACELTEKYKALQHVVLTEVLEPYNDCANSISKAKYWYKYVQCKNAGDGNSISGGCADLVLDDNIKYKDLELDADFCQRLKVDKEELMEYLECSLNETNIKKCK